MLLHRPLPLKGNVGRTLLQHALSHVVAESRTVDQEEQDEQGSSSSIANIVEYDDEDRHSSHTGNSTVRVWAMFDWMECTQQLLTPLFVDVY